MAALELVVGHDPNALLEEAAAGFLEPRRAGDLWPTPRHVLAVRQGGVRDDLYALMARRGVHGWFDPPLYVFAELPEILGEPAKHPLGDYERVSILGGIIRQRAGLFARPGSSRGFIDAIDRFIGELIAEGVSPDEFGNAIARVESRDAFQRQRDDDLAGIYSDYLARLERHGSDPRSARGDLAARISADPAALAAKLHGRREIHLFGLLDLRGGWRALLRALVTSPALDRIGIYTSVPLDVSSVARSTTRYIPEDEPAAQLFGGAWSSRRRLPVTAIDAPDLEREIEEVACHVRKLADSGVALDRIAIVARQARPCVNLAVKALGSVGVPAAARLRTANADIPALRAMLTLIAAAADKWSRHTLTELAEHPYFRGELDARIIDHIGFQTRVTTLNGWLAAFADLEARATRRENGADDDNDEHRAALPAAARVAAARSRFVEFAVRARLLDGERPLVEWVRWLRDFVREDSWGVRVRLDTLAGGRLDIARLDTAGWRGLDAIVGQWLAALEDKSDDDAELLDACHFDQTLREMLVGDVALPTSTPRGVRVLEGLAAAQRAFDHVFIVGLDTGSFPLRAPVSPLHDDLERRALAAAGLPLETSADWDVRERELFRALVASARVGLTIGSARIDSGGRNAVRSVFAEELESVADVSRVAIATSRVSTPGIPDVVDESDRQHAHRTARIERGRETGVASAWNGTIEDVELIEWLGVKFGPDRVWSASQIESYAKCPFSYFANRVLSLDAMDDPSDEMEHTVRGTLLHDTMRRFFEKAAATLGSPVFLREQHLDWARAQIDMELGEAMDFLATKESLGHPTLLDAKRAELSRMLRKFVEFEIDSNEKTFVNRGNARFRLRTGVIQHEMQFGFEEPFTIEAGGETLRVRGSIDRLEESVDNDVNAPRYIAAVDYKTTEWSTPGGGKKEAWEDRVVLQVPLYAIVAQKLRPGSTIARVEYQAIKGCKTVHSVQLVQVDRRAKKLDPDAEARTKLDTAVAAIGEHVRQARGGAFAANPAKSCGCPDFCVAIDICRVAGGPVRSGW